MQIKSSKKISLLELLQELAPESSKNRLRLWVETGRVLVDGQAPKHINQIVNEGQKVTVGTKPKFLQEDLKIIFEDEDLVVVDKPAGLLSVATDLEKERTVHAFLKRRFHNRMVYPIHRLDQETSGLLVFTYTKQARDYLKNQLQEHTMQREYRALVHGHPGKGTWRCSLAENAHLRVYVTKRGKEAVTHFETVQKKKTCSLLRLKLETGRKHQIRVQAAHHGYPIVGDSKYGSPEDAGKNLQLRAVGLAFSHPRTKKQMRFSDSYTQTS